MSRFRRWWCWLTCGHWPRTPTQMAVEANMLAADRACVKCGQRYSLIIFCREDEDMERVERRARAAMGDK